jgi:Uma2 family endonuclease
MTPPRQGHDEPLPTVDERLVAPENRFEVIDGQVIECGPAEERHATAHSNVDFVIRAHARPSFRVAVDMLTRSNRFSDTAPDISVFPGARDRKTGGRQVEHIAIEVRDTQALSEVTAKARLLHTRGVRRILCLDVPKARVLEWNSSQDEWDELPLSSKRID